MDRSIFATKSTPWKCGGKIYIQKNAGGFRSSSSFIYPVHELQVSIKFTNHEMFTDGWRNHPGVDQNI